MPTGTVRWFDNRERGFGFIAPDGGGEGDDVYVHISGVAKHVVKLHPGQRVTFETEPGRRGGVKAVGVTPIE
jgi:cold shock protein